MNTLPTDATPWRSGRLAVGTPSRRFQVARSQWIGAVLLVASALVFAGFVAVLESDVHRNEVAHAEQRARANAVADCRAAHPAGGAAACQSLYADGAVSARPAPPNEVYELRSGERVPTQESETTPP